LLQRTPQRLWLGRQVRLAATIFVECDALVGCQVDVY
jgi:hypothetical protein